jgi:hypothetical protein
VKPKGEAGLSADRADRGVMQNKRKQPALKRFKKTSQPPNERASHKERQRVAEMCV